MARPRTHDDRLRIRLVDEAGRLLAADGPSAVTMRRLTERAQTSSSAVYTLFGDKSGLVREMFVEGFRRLALRFAEVKQTDDPGSDLIALGWAFRANALANRHLYDLMFGGPFHDFRPGQLETEESLGTFQALIHAVQRCIDDGVIGAVDATDVAMVLLGLVTGLASLELKGWLGTAKDAERRWDLALRMALKGLRGSSS